MAMKLLVRMRSAWPWGLWFSLSGVISWKRREGRWRKRWQGEKGDATACLIGGCCSVLSGRRKRIQEEKRQRNKKLEACGEIESGEKKGGLLLCSASIILFYISFLFHIGKVGTHT
jgi:hypothetical protein